MKDLTPLTSIHGVESDFWTTRDGQLHGACGQLHQDEMHLVSIGLHAASIAQAMQEVQPGSQEIFVRFAERSLYARLKASTSLLVVCHESVHLETLRLAVSRLLQTSALAPRAGSTHKTDVDQNSPRTGRRRTRTGIWG